MILRLAATNIDRVQLFSVASVTLNASALALAMKGADKDGSFDMAVNQRSLSCWAETTDEWGLLEVELESIESLEVDEAAGGSQGAQHSGWTLSLGKNGSLMITT